MNINPIQVTKIYKSVRSVPYLYTNVRKTKCSHRELNGNSSADFIYGCRIKNDIK